MYCKNCGSHLDDRAVVCPNCGVPTGVEQPQQQSGSNTIAIVGFILSFFLPIVGLICSIIGYKNSSQLNGTGKGIALAGIIISSVIMVLGIMTSFIAMSYMEEYFSDYTAFIKL